MTTEQISLEEAARKLGLQIDGCELSVLTPTNIAARLRQTPPYLALTRALLCSNGESSELLAEAHFPPEICDGHYPGSPSIPLVDMGRAMDEAAAVWLCRNHHVPLLKRISKLRAESMEAARPGTPYFIRVSQEKGEVLTKLFSSVSYQPLATIQGWQYNFVSVPEISSTPRFEADAAVQIKSAITWLNEIDQTELSHRIPQLPPFLVLKSAKLGITETGGHVVSTISGFKTEAVSGHFTGLDALGPMHYSRSLAQTGMLMASLCGELQEVVPEVVSAKAIWYDTREYFRPEVEVETIVFHERSFSRGGLSFVTLNGVVLVHGQTVLGTDSFVYVLVPRAQHPAASQMKT
jgi:hypothetical protein